MKINGFKSLLIFWILITGITLCAFNSVKAQQFSGNLMYITVSPPGTGDDIVADSLRSWGFTIDELTPIGDFQNFYTTEELSTNYVALFFSEYCGSSDAQRLRGATAGTWDEGWIPVPVVSTDNWFSKVGSLGFTDVNSAGPSDYGNVGPNGQVVANADVKIVDFLSSAFSSGFAFGETFPLVSGTDDGDGHLINFAVPKIEVVPIAALAGSVDGSQLCAYGVENGTQIYNSAGELVDTLVTTARYASVGIMGGALNYITAQGYQLLKGAFSWVLEGAVDVKSEESLPIRFTLEQNYPNPFNPSTQIRYSIPKESKVTLEVFDVLGRKVSTLVNETKLSGEYSAVFNSSNLSSGMYIYRLTAGNQIVAKTMMLLK